MMNFLHFLPYHSDFIDRSIKLLHDWSDFYGDESYIKSSEFSQVTQPGNYWAERITAKDINQRVFSLNQQSSKVLISNGFFININQQSDENINGGVISQFSGYSFHYIVCAMNCNANIGSYIYIFPNNEVFNNYSTTQSTFTCCKCTNSVLFIESKNILHKKLNITHSVGISRCAYVFRVKSENGTSKFNNLAYCNSSNYLILHRQFGTTLMEHCNVIKNYNSGDKGLIGIMDQNTSLIVKDSIFRQNICNFMFYTDFSIDTTSISLSDCYFHGDSFNSFSNLRNIIGSPINSAKNPYDLGLYSSAVCKAATPMQCQRICQNYNHPLGSILRRHR